MAKIIRCILYRSNCYLVFGIVALSISIREGNGAIPPELAANVAANWLQSYLTSGLTGWSNSIKPALGNYDLLMENDDTLAYIFPITPSGYVAISCYEEMFPIIAYSTSDTINTESICGFINVLRDDLIGRVNYIKAIRSGFTTPPENDNGTFALARNRMDWSLWSETPEKFIAKFQPEITANAEQVGPLLQSRWGQGNPYNKYCPLGNNNVRCVVGCVATATSQIMHYWQWPANGSGSHSYYWDGDGTAPGQNLSANFADNYDWANILANYNAGYNVAQANAVAELCYEVGVAYEMDYGAQGSGAYMQYCQSILPGYFGYRNSIVEELRSRHTASSWFATIQSEINANRVIFYGIRNQYQEGHALCCDGWNVMGQTMFIHMNYGWEGSYDNWYHLDNLYNSVYQNDHFYRGIQGGNEVYVWPGDADNNGTVDTLDIYALVVYWYQTGPGRGVVDYSWSAHQLRAWSVENATYADCDGSGRVDIRDALPVCLNWGQDHPVLKSTTLPPIDLANDSIRAIFMEFYNSLESSNSEAAYQLRRFIENKLNLNTPSDIELYQNYPNPFNPSTKISYRLIASGKTRLAIYNLGGQLVRLLVEKEEGHGLHQAIWDGRDSDNKQIAAGVYFCRLEALGENRVMKMILTK